MKSLKKKFSKDFLWLKGLKQVKQQASAENVIFNST